MFNADHHMVPNEALVASMARALFVEAWASAEEAAGRTYPGQDLMDVAPEAPIEAHTTALVLIGRIEERNGLSMASIAVEAWRCDGNSPVEGPTDAFVAELGHCLVMQALGHGVAWTDNHEAITWKVAGLPRGAAQGQLSVPSIESMVVDLDD